MPKNRSPETPGDTGSPVTAYEVTGEEPGATNDFGRERVGVGERSLEAKGDSLEYVFPACSVTVLRVGLA